MVRIFFLLLLVSSQTIILAQQLPLSTKSKKAIELYTEADNYRVRGENTRAIQLLIEAIDKDKKFVEAYYRLGVVYYTIKDLEQAKSNFEKALSLTDDPRKQKIIFYDLGETNFAMGKYDKAEEYLNSFLKLELANKVKIDKANQLLKNVAFAKENSKLSTRYKQKKLSDSVNAFVLQYFPVLTADQQELIFTRRLGPNGGDDEDLVISRKTPAGRWGIPESLSDKINSTSNEGTCSISADGRRLIFTSCVGRQGYGSCDLFESRKIGDDWTTPKNLGPNVNTSEWESQPSLSADGRTLYFVSDRRSGIGRRDIWVSTLNEKGTWTKARNAGKPINTVYDEISPFIHANSRVLYFASNGLTGFGGYDIFYSAKDTANNWTDPVNMGSPINTNEDQFSLFITVDGKKGYYSHEEAKPQGYSVSYIYEIEIPEEQQVKSKTSYVRGIVRDKQSREPLVARIELIDLKTNETESLVESDSITGQYLFVLTEGSEYALYVNKKNYLFQSLNFNYSEAKNSVPIILNIDLEKAREGTVSVLQNIFFDVDKYDLKPKSKTELQKILKFLQDNPLIRVEISGHTDNTGSTAYNKQLSQKRAQSVYDYLVQNGINGQRLIPKGFGSEQPIADNASEEGKQKNRRIQFKIIR
jgi:outer membrane protein OmpA-like peptidoglycan-associated protein